MRLSHCPAPLTSLLTGVAIDCGYQSRSWGIVFAPLRMGIQAFVTSIIARTRLPRVGLIFLIGIMLVAMLLSALIPIKRSPSAMTSDHF